MNDKLGIDDLEKFLKEFDRLKIEQRRVCQHLVKLCEDCPSVKKTIDLMKSRNEDFKTSWDSIVHFAFSQSEEASG